MIEVRSQRRHRGAILGLLVLVAALVTFFVFAHSHGRHASARRSPVPAGTTGPHSLGTKRVCPSPVPGALPAGIVARDRILVPYSDKVLGVDQKWADAPGHRFVEVLSGGYIDDITEPYDGLHPTASATLHGARITVLTTNFLNRRVYLGYWVYPGVAVPCDIHALVTEGLPRHDFDAMLGSLR